MRKYLKFVLCLCFLFMLCGCEEQKEDLNYTKSSENNITYYEINNKKYIESEEETNLIKIDVNNYGIIIAELYPNVAPITVKNFKKLVSKSYYDGLIFHRVIKDFMIQTGDPSGTGTGGSDETIKGEFSENGVENTLSHKRGVLSMARKGSDPETEETYNSGSSQFFIVHQDSTFLDGKYAAFGMVIDGIEIVDKIASVDTNSLDKPVNKVIINSIKFVEDVSK